MKIVNLVLFTLALVAFIVATSLSVSAYYPFYHSYYSPYSYSPYSYGYEYGGYGGYTGGSSYGSIIGPLWYRTSFVSPFTVDRSLAFEEQNPMTRFSLDSTNQMYSFVSRTQSFY